MKYKIINTTDRKNLGLIIENNVESYLLKNDYLFIPTNKKFTRDFMYLSNSNYIIEAIRIK